MNKTIGILGGGQLGQMLTEAAHKLQIRVVTLDREHCPAMKVNASAEHVHGSFTDVPAIRRLAARCDVMTVETEHVDTSALESLVAEVEIQPSWQAIKIIQDKYNQKLHLSSNGIRVVDSLPINTPDVNEAQRVIDALGGYPCMLKSRTEAYDGRGNYPVKAASEIPVALAKLKGRPLYAERWAHFKSELAVMVVKIGDGSIDQWQDFTLAYPVVETIHEDSICKLVYAPARDVSTPVMQKAQELARRAVATLQGRGVFGVEMFLLEDGELRLHFDNWLETNSTGELLINEIAPRPHNSGHYTIEACGISQYEAHISAILELPIPPESTRLANDQTYAVMVNLLGGAQADSHLQAAYLAKTIPMARVHLYGKEDARPGRKMGHVTIRASSAVELEERVKPLVDFVDKMRAECGSASISAPIGSRVDAKRDLKAGSESTSPDLNMKNLPSNNIDSPTPLVAVTMGSDSDRFVLADGIHLLEKLQIPHFVTITSAHRTPKRMTTFAEGAAAKGFKVIIAAAGGAAHLPGMIAASTELPVIGVPVKGKALDGMDSLLSIVQMPVGLIFSYPQTVVHR